MTLYSGDLEEHGAKQKSLGNSGTRNTPIVEPRSMLNLAGAPKGIIILMRQTARRSHATNPLAQQFCTLIFWNLGPIISSPSFLFPHYARARCLPPHIPYVDALAIQENILVESPATPHLLHR